MSTPIKTVTPETMKANVEKLVSRKTTVTFVSEAVLHARKVIEAGNKADFSADLLEAASYIENELKRGFGLERIFVDRIETSSAFAKKLMETLKAKVSVAPIITSHGVTYTLKASNFSINLSLVFTSGGKKVSTLIVLEAHASQAKLFSHEKRFAALQKQQGKKNSVPVKKSTWHAESKHQINGVGRQTNIYASHVAGEGLVKGVLSVPGTESETVSMRLMTMIRAHVGNDVIDAVKHSLVKGELSTEFHAITTGYENMVALRREVKGSWVGRLLLSFCVDFEADPREFSFDEKTGLLKALTQNGRRALARALEKKATYESGKWDAAVRKMATTAETDSLREQSNAARELLKLRAQLLADKCFPEHAELAQVLFVALSRSCTPNRDIFPSLMEDAYLTALSMVEGAKFNEGALARFVKLTATEDKSIQFFFPCSPEDAKRATVARPQDTELVFIEQREGDYVLVLEDEQGELTLDLQANAKYIKQLQGVSHVQGHLKTWKKGATGISIHLYDLDIVHPEGVEQAPLVMAAPTLEVTLSADFKAALAEHGTDVMLGQNYTFMQDTERGFTYGMLGQGKAFRVNGLHDLTGRELQSDGYSFWI